jgi:signal peptidase I
MSWLRYRHILRGDGKPELITDFMGYNSSEGHGFNGTQCVGDLMLECNVTVQKAVGQLRLELSKGVDRFQARFDLATSTCKFVRLGMGGEKEMGTVTAPLNQAGTYRLRFANVDQALRLWVDDKLLGEDKSAAVAYEAAGLPGPTPNDLQPASIGGQGALTVSGIKLWRDNYYTISVGGGLRDITLTPETLDDPTTWEELNHPPVRTFYIHPGHYFFLGDNSSASADSRFWGLVPERNILGPAVLRYYPFSRASWVR